MIRHPSLRLAMALVLLALAPASLFAGPAASDTALRALASAEAGKGWDAVGRLDMNGTGFCTGALIAEDLVITAAHCLFDPKTGAPLAAETIEFRAGWRHGRAAAYRQVRRAVVHPSYVFSAKADANRVRHDLALLQLHQPIRTREVVPFETDIKPRAGGRIGVVSYAHNRSDAPSLQETCAVLSRQQGLLVMSCDVDFGASGAPVFSFDGDAPRIVSVVSAMASANGAPVSLGTALEEPLSQLKAALVATSPFRPARSRSETGAKFVRP